VNAEQNQIEQATSHRQQQEGALYHPDGSKIFADAEHREHLRAIEREFATTMDKIQAAIEERAERARGELAALEHADPAAGLSTDDLQRAAALSAFVGEEVEGLSLADLARRLRAAASSGDRAGSYALLHHAARRQNEDLSGEVRDAVAELRRALDPGREEKAEAAKASLEEAEDLQFKAQLARAGANNLGDALFGGGQGPASYWGAAS
jgi:hypothetical protein